MPWYDRSDVSDASSRAMPHGANRVQKEMRKRTSCIRLNGSICRNHPHLCNVCFIYSSFNQGLVRRATVQGGAARVAAADRTVRGDLVFETCNPVELRTRKACIF